MSEDTGEKQFDPSQKRKDDATKKGDVLRSKEVGTAVATLVGTAWLYLQGGALLDSMKEVARRGFGFGRGAITDFDPGAAMIEAVSGVMIPIASLGLIVMVITVAASFVGGDGFFIANNLAPKGSRIDPIKGLGRMFGKQGLIELGKGILKVVLLGGIAIWWGIDAFYKVIALGRGDLMGQLGLAWREVIEIMVLMGIGLVLIAMVDWPIQFIQRMGRLKMSHQDVRDETKQQEGSPEKRQAIRNKQRQIAMGGINKAMQSAQFVLTNPTHFAVAMTYDPALAEAPVVLAKARGDKALAMRELAREMNIPVLEFPALARSVYFTTRENQMIRAELYGAIASILSFVLSLKRGEKRKRPSIALPPDLHFDTEGKLSGLNAKGGRPS